MYSDDDIELTTEERAALAALPREMAPSDLLEERVVRALKNQGEFDSAPTRGRRTLSVGWKVAAAMALFAGGVATGHYLLDDGSSQSASASTPASEVRSSGVTRNPHDATRPVRRNEPVVAERELWL